MIFSVHNLAKNLSYNKQPVDLTEGFAALKILAEQEKAGDKWGNFAASTQIFLVAMFITYMAVSFICCIWPPASLKQMRKFIASFTEESAASKKTDDEKLEEGLGMASDIMDLANRLCDFIPHASFASGGGFAGYIYYRKRRKKLNGGKSAMDIAIEEEMRRLKSAIENSENSVSDENGNKSKNKSNIGALDGATLVELFNNFADIMEIRGDLPRNREETAAEYFSKLATEIRFSKEKADKAARYFENELYGQRETSPEDKRAFIELLLEMMSKSKRA